MTSADEPDGTTEAGDQVASNATQQHIERILLGGERKYTRLDVIAKSGIPPERTRDIWRALGFADVGDDDVAFTDADLDALKLGEDLVAGGIITAEGEVAMTRTLGHHLSRLAEWQVLMLWNWLAERPEFAQDEQQAMRLVEQLVPELEQLQNHVWRRHLAAYSGRALAAPDEDADTRIRTVGFADMVGYTRMTRRIDEFELSRVLDRFESTANDVIAGNHGRVVKMIGDEVLFVADDPADAAEIGLTLTELAEQDEDIPEVRTGMARGRVLSRFGDVYGSVVNLAARLTSVARPGTILVDQDLAAALKDSPGYELRTRRPVSVRGYKRLRPIVLRRA